MRVWRQSKRQIFPLSFLSSSRPPPSLRAIRSNRVYGAMREKRIRNEKGTEREKGYQADLGNEKA